MRFSCSMLKDRLETLGAPAVHEIDGAQSHLEVCDRCFEAFEESAALDDVLGEYRASSERPMTTTLVERVLACTAAMPFEEPRTAAPARSGWQSAARSLRPRGLPWPKLAPQRRAARWRSPLAFNRREFRTLVGAAAVACIALLLAPSVDPTPEMKRAVRLPSPSAGTVRPEAYGDLITSFRNEIENGQAARRRLADKFARNEADLSRHKGKVASIFEALIDKYEQLAKEVDALSSSLRSQQDQIPLPARELVGPDELERLGFDAPAVAPPPPPMEIASYDHGASYTVSPPPVNEPHSGLFGGAPNDSKGDGVDAPGSGDGAVLNALRRQLQTAASSGDEPPVVLERPQGKEVRVYVTPGEPTQLEFAADIRGGYKRSNSAISLERNGRYLIVFAQPEIPYEGEAILIQLDDGRTFALRILPADDEHPRKPIVPIDEQHAYLGTHVTNPMFFDEPRATVEGGSGEFLALPGSFAPFGGPVQWFESVRGKRDGLTFKEATGYWANTYLPGDPTARGLRSRLAAWNPADLERLIGRPLSLHQSAFPPGQPFDAPADAALALFLHADTIAVAGPRRTLLQLGLQGGSARLGRRPEMNVGVVLDLRTAPSEETMRAMQKLLFTLHRLHELGDRFSLSVAGPHGGLHVPSSEFRHGTLRILFDRLTANAPLGAPTSLHEAFEAALTETVRRSNPDEALGANLLLLVTAESIADASGRIEELAAWGASLGIASSAIGIGGNVRREELESFALAGHGRRWTLSAADDAEQSLRGELAAASRAVARAVRVTITLAPGVQLVDVLGSTRLDEQAAATVKDSERRIDRQLADALGIEADRGSDSNGIQIVIPAFYAGDSHVILLDVVVPGPGPVAEASIRYKDILHYRNTVARAELSLAEGSEEAGPLEKNVLQNYLALGEAAVLQQAAALLERDQPAAALEMITSYRELLEALEHHWSLSVGGDGINRDLALLSEYAAVLASPNARSTPYLSESLRLAGVRKLRLIGDATASR